MEEPQVAGFAPGPVRNALRSPRQAPPSTLAAHVSEPGELVARALTILAGEAEAWRTRRNGGPSQGSVQ